jgi:hypothetical protein
MFTFSLEFALLFPFFPQQELPILENSKPKNHVGWGEGG